MDSGIDHSVEAHGLFGCAALVAALPPAAIVTGVLRLAVGALVRVSARSDGMRHDRERQSARECANGNDRHWPEKVHCDARHGVSSGDSPRTSRPRELEELVNQD